MKPHGSLRRVRRRLSAALAALTVFTGLAACGVSSGAGSSGQPDELHVLVEAMQPVFDQWQGGVTTQGVLLLVNEPLIRYDGDGFQPNVAASFDQVSPTKFVFELRDDVRFSDGSELTAEDVKFTFQQAMRDDHMSTTHIVMKAIKSIDVSGKTLTVELAQPHSLFLYTVARTGIVSKAFYDKHGDKVGTPDVGQLGSGPYQLVKFEPNKTMTIGRNPDYWGDQAPFSSITFTIVSDDSARLLALHSGEANAIFEIPTGQIKAVRTVEDFTFTTIDGTSLIMLMMDVTKPPFDDPDVRAAVRHAINRQGVVDSALAGNGQVARTLVSASTLERVASPHAVENTLGKFDKDNAFDPDLAKRLLRKAGKPNGFSVTLPVESTDADASLVAQALAQDLKRVGIDVRLEQKGDDYVEVILRGKHEGVLLFQFSSNAPDPVMPMDYFVPAKSHLNLTRQNTPAADEALARSHAIPVGEAKRGQALLSGLEAYHSAGASLPLAIPDMTFGLKKPMTINGFTNYWWMQRWDLLVGVNR